ncbi:DNA-binding protein [Cyanobacterium aponinum AL20118]|uniref:DNA-binding protein n=1 Tax=Cyanobacterium aponinum AL20115 TaxID=3090662 RepID=A0AAF0ZGH0_9CHRO|nr:DNA-binding protein [Cyanobacterium aponinum]WPF90013.1 DNA-binding protein [Cyanobacterium aponinum AL20115]
MTREYSLRVRLTDDEKSRLAYYAKRKNVSMSEIIQDYCKRLPKPPSAKD